MKKLLGFAFAFLVSTTAMAVAAQAQPAPTASPTGAASAAPSDVAAKIDAIQAQLDALKLQLDQLRAANLPPGAPPAGPTTDIFGRPVDAQGRTVDFQPEKPAAPTPLVFDPKAKSGITFLTKGGTLSLYGNLDLSYDVTTKGLAQHYYPYTQDTPVGNVGWSPAISTNLSYFGIRGMQALGRPYGFVYQLETQIDVSSTSGTVNTNSNNDNVVKGGLTSRNSFIGVSNQYAGTFRIGKTDAPYKDSTARMNPFSGELGDYSVIMGNSGGDNRVEFGTRLDHALWYESPTVHGFKFNFLVAPGQNRAEDDSLIAAGEAGCAGGNAPGSGALSPACNDGAFGTAYSTSVQYQTGKLYLTTAFELHKAVNRVSDLPIPDPNDVVDESATKGGFQYAFSKRTLFSAIYEDLERYDPGYLQYQNERSRNGFWLAATQYLNIGDNINFGWARANPTPGDPGQHNTPGGAHPDNMANMYTFAFKHPVNNLLQFYVDYALTLNHPDAHYDLGAGGRGVTTDCHDASQLAAYDPTTGGVSGSGPHCYAGGRLQGVSAGMDFKF
jgi:predicted porin